jgi:hypothetical protein
MPDFFALLISFVAVTNIAWLLHLSLLMADLKHKHLPTFLDLVRPAWFPHTVLISLRALAFIHSHRLDDLNDIHLSRRARRVRAHFYVAIALDVAFLALRSLFV